ncbi:MAG TPA: M28 family peptidase [Bryobacterales bacterium]|nr:M28 family peptidase [Bryobacterales bacterium]
MSRQEILTLLASAALAFAASRGRGAGATPPAFFNGQAALDATRRIVAFGPRPAGSPAHRKLRQWLAAELRPLPCEVVEDAFTARTPRGPRAMTNLIAKFPGSSKRVVVISGHYDTYDRPGLHFVGANDGGSSAAFLLQLARTLPHFQHRDAIWLVWFDGEESMVSWEGEDHTYGSRHLAQKWKADGTADSILALLNVDMIGDADLSLVYELNSTSWLRDLVWSVAGRLGYTSQFSRKYSSAIEDDHVSFLNIGIPVLDLIDLDYGPDNSYWHTERDTVDKLSPRSFEIIGQVVLETVRALEQRTSRW